MWDILLQLYLIMAKRKNKLKYIGYRACTVPSWSWSYGCQIYNLNYLCNPYLSLLMLWVRIPLMAELPVQSVPITTNVVGSNPAHGRVYTIQHYVINFVSDLWQACGFLRPCTLVSSTNKTDCHNMTEILSEMALKHYKP